MMMEVMPSESYSVVMRLEHKKELGSLGRITTAISNAGAEVTAIDLVKVDKKTVTRDISFMARNVDHGQKVIEAVVGSDGIRIVNVSDSTFLIHLGGKIEVTNKVPVKTREDLSRAYTPGVGRICMAIYEDPKKVFNLTIKKNMVAVVTDGSAVLGLGNIGPGAALPVMEGKAMLFKEFGDVDAFPICLDTQDPGEIIQCVKAIAPVFGGINLEDIAAPKCFEVEDALVKALDIPVFHDDQHGTAVVVMAALLNAAKIVKKELEDLKIVMTGAGASGTACIKMFLHYGIKDIVCCDRSGIIFRGREEHMNPAKEWLAENTNPGNIRGSLADSFEGRDLFLGLSGPGLVTADMLKKMGRDPIVFAMANPVPEIMPEEAEPYVKVMATGRSDYPNQVNNALCFPGIFRGALDVRACKINENMKVAAVKAIASIIKKDELGPEYIIPSIFDKRVVKNVATEVGRAAHKSCVARRIPKSVDVYHF